MSEIALPEVYAIDPKPGDTVVVSYAVNLTHEQAHEVHERAQARFPDCQITVLDLGGRIEVQPKDGD